MFCSPALAPRGAFALLLVLLSACAGDTSDLCAAVTCATGRTCVEGKCVDSPVDCAGQTCPAGTQCVGGQCVSPCGGASGCLAGLICCSGACITTAINTAHCGTCDKTGMVCCVEGVSTCVAGTYASCTGTGTYYTGSMCCI